MNEVKTNFSKVPNELLYLKLNHSELKIVLYIFKYNNPTGKSGISATEFMNNCNISSKATIHKALNALEKRNVIKRVSMAKKGKRNLISIKPTSEWKI